jgi:adenosylhomocysteinase
VLSYPVVAINDADTKHLFDNRYGTGQSTLDGDPALHEHAARRLDGCCRRLRLVRPRVAMRARGMGAIGARDRDRSVKAIEAAMDGFEVLTMESAAPRGNLFITMTGNKTCCAASIQAMRDGAIVCNSATSTSRSTSRRSRS